MKAMWSHYFQLTVSKNWVVSWWFYQFFTFLKARLSLTAPDRWLENQLYHFLLSGQDFLILNKWPFLYDFKESKLISLKNSGHSFSISKLKYSCFIKFPLLIFLVHHCEIVESSFVKEKKKKKSVTCHITKVLEFGYSVCPSKIYIYRWLLNLHLISRGFNIQV